MRVIERLAGSLGLFWEARGYFREGRERLAAIHGLGHVKLNGNLLAHRERRRALPSSQSSQIQ